jgi:hypothetical protein
MLGSASVFLAKGVPQINALTTLAFGDDPLGKYQIHLLRHGTELEISGPLTFGLTNDVRRILDANTHIKVMHLNSDGGRLAEARHLRDLIRERSLTTYTATRCSSACTIAFLGGHKRLIAAEARLGFHQYTFPGMDQKDLQAEYAKDRRSMVAAGVSPAFAKRAFLAPNTEMWYPTPQELLQAGVITGFASKADFALSGVVAYRDRAKLERLLTQLPVYEAIKQFDPDIYEKIITHMERSAQEGRTEAELLAEVRQQIASLVHRYMPVAADEPLLEMTGVIIRQLEVLVAKSPALCYRVLFPQGAPPLDFATLLPKDLQEAELRVLPALIATGATQPQPLPTKKQVAKSLQRVMASLARTHGHDMHVLANLTAPDIDQQKACDITISLYREILKLPSPTNVRVLRYMFAAQ